MTTETVGSVVSQAAPVAIKVSINKLDFDRKCKEHFDKIKGSLPKEIIQTASKGFKEPRMKKVAKLVGFETLFREPLVKEITSQLSKDRPDDEILIYGNTHVDEFDGKYNITGAVYLCPTVTWLSAAPNIGTISVQAKPTDANIEAKLGDYIEGARLESVVLTQVDRAAVDGDMLTLDCESTIDGVLWHPGCVQKKKWAVMKEVCRIPGLYDNMLGAKADDTIQFKTTLTKDFGEMDGKEVVITLTVWSVCAISKPEIDNDLALTNGFQTLEEWKHNIRVFVRNKLIADREQSVLSTVSKEFDKISTISEIPQQWLRAKSIEIFNMDSGRYGAFEDMQQNYIKQMQIGHMPTNDEMVDFISVAVAASFKRDLVFRSWGRLNGVPGDSRMNSIDSYITAVEKHILNMLEA